MNPENLIDEARQKMQKTLDHLREELSGVRTGRASPSLLETIKVDVYGTKMDLRDLASINAPEPRLLVVQVWDQANIAAIERAIRGSDLALNPVTENNIIRVPIPPLSEERRREMSKIVSEKLEASRVNIRQTRRDAVEAIEAAEKRKEVSEDEKFRATEKVQKATEEFTGKVDSLAKQKENEILQI
ncbi:MAG: ribosome recycling factor [bacterium]|nr:ribosome recycling factor [bacterium]